MLVYQSINIKHSFDFDKYILHYAMMDQIQNKTQQYPECKNRE